MNTYTIIISGHRRNEIDEMDKYNREEMKLKNARVWSSSAKGIGYSEAINNILSQYGIKTCKKTNLMVEIKLYIDKEWYIRNGIDMCTKTFTACMTDIRSTIGQGNILEAHAIFESNIAYLVIDFVPIFSKKIMPHKFLSQSFLKSLYKSLDKRLDQYGLTHGSNENMVRPRAEALVLKEINYKIREIDCKLNDIVNSLKAQNALLDKLCV